MVKNFKILYLWKQKDDDLETWYVALSTRVLLNLFKWCPWVDHDLFYGMVKFGPTEAKFHVELPWDGGNEIMFK